jgi:hypothetical protein
MMFGKGDRAHDIPDAYWEVPSADYVPLEGQSGQDLLDDRDRLDAAWKATVDTLRREADESDEVRARIAAEVKAFDKDRREQQSRRHHPEPDPPTGGLPGMPRPQHGWFFSIVQSFLHGLRRLALHRT